MYVPSLDDGGVQVDSVPVGTSSTGKFATGCDSLKVTSVVAPDIMSLGCMALTVGTTDTSVGLLISRAPIISMKREDLHNFKN